MNNNKNANSAIKKQVLCVILARAGSKGLPNKNALSLGGQPLLHYTIDHAKSSQFIDHIVLTTDGEHLAEIGRRGDIEVMMRPPALANDTATVDAATRHAVETVERNLGQTFDSVVILYGNVPLRPANLINDALQVLHTSDCDSVQSVHPVGKTHPYWMKTVDADGRLSHYQPNTIYRRQDLPPVFMLDGAIIAVSRESLFRVAPADPHAFLGEDRRAVITPADATVDIDEAIDLERAETRLKSVASNRYRFPSMFAVAGRNVGIDDSPYVIAELGVNHDGQLSKGIELIAAAKDAGADAVKVQLFDANLLLSEEAVLAAYQKNSANDVFEMLANLQLSDAEMLTLRHEAKRHGMGFIATCFSVELFDSVEMLDPDAIKLASPDAVNLPLIEAMATLHKPLLISTGTCQLNELDAAASMLAAREVAFLHCVSSYPVPNELANLPRIAALRSRFGAPVGYSDHTCDLHGGMLAVASQRACIIEKHLTHDCNAIGPDHAASFNPEQFAKYVKLIKAAWHAHSPTDTTELEAEVRQVSRQSVCATRPLRAGQIIRRDDLNVKRPGTGIPAARLKEVIGQIALRDIAANQLIREDSIAPADASHGVLLRSA